MCICRPCRRLLASTFGILFLLLSISFSSAETDGAAPSENVSRQCKLTCTQAGLSPYSLNDGNIRTSQIMAEGASLTYRWDAEVAVSSCHLFFVDCPESCLLTQKDADGQVLSETEYTITRRYEWIDLDAGCCELTLLLNQRCKLASFEVYSGAVPPPDVIVWDTEVADEHVDLLMISTHCDDEILMMGGVLPIYAGEEGRDCVVIYMKAGEVPRQIESILGLWEMGVTREPIFLNHSNGSLEASLADTDASRPKYDALKHLVGFIRRYRPDVVVTQDEAGEYGHEAHIFTVALVKQAVALASDVTQFPASAEKYGAWQTKKLYLHLYAQDALTLDVDAPLANMGGRSAFVVATDAFAYHVSQQQNWSVRKTHAKFPIGNFGLYFSAVGEDALHTDMFEHIVKEPFPTPTAEPTAVPTAAPTKTPPVTAAPTVAPTAEPVADVQPSGASPLSLVLFAVAGAALVALIVVLSMRCKKRKQQQHE